MYSLPTEKSGCLQEKITILSGLYGLLKPLDLMQPYRLEMQNFNRHWNEEKNLYEFYGRKYRSPQTKDNKETNYFLNLANSRYFSSVNTKALKVQWYPPNSKDYKDGKLK